MALFPDLVERRDGHAAGHAEFGYLFDVNADGLDDSVGPDGVRLKMGPIPDLMTRVDMPLGGRINVT